MATKHTTIEYMCDCPCKKGKIYIIENITEDDFWANSVKKYFNFRIRCKKCNKKYIIKCINIWGKNFLDTFNENKKGKSKILHDKYSYPVIIPKEVKINTEINKYGDDYRFEPHLDIIKENKCDKSLCRVYRLEILKKIYNELESKIEYCEETKHILYHYKYRFKIYSKNKVKEKIKNAIKQYNNYYNYNNYLQDKDKKIKYLYKIRDKVKTIKVQDITKINER